MLLFYMKFPPRTTGLLQAAGLTLYVSLFAMAAREFQQWVAAQAVKPEPILGIILFLLAFIISAIICSAIIFAYPLFLFFGNKKDDAVKIILWSVCGLILFFVSFLIIGSIVFANSF